MPNHHLVNETLRLARLVFPEERWLREFVMTWRYDGGRAITGLKMGDKAVIRPRSVAEHAANVDPRVLASARSYRQMCEDFRKVLRSRGIDPDAR